MHGHIRTRDLSYFISSTRKKAQSMRPVLLICGIHNSGPTHWQSLWEKNQPDVTRVAQENWDQPACAAWVEGLDRAVRSCNEPPVLVAHSLGCLAVAHWAAQNKHRAKGHVHAALMVAVPDPAGPTFPAQASGFAPLPDTVNELPLTMVSSSNDPYSTPAYTTAKATLWGADHECWGALGHINANSGLADWPQGWAVVQRLRGCTTPT
jgi:uncharacterized protein